MSQGHCIKNANSVITVLESLHSFTSFNFSQSPKWHKNCLFLLLSFSAIPIYNYLLKF